MCSTSLVSGLSRSRCYSCASSREHGGRAAYSWALVADVGDTALGLVPSSVGSDARESIAIWRHVLNEQNLG